jgi:hypothetical protein
MAIREAVEVAYGGPTFSGPSYAGLQFSDGGLLLQSVRCGGEVNSVNSEKVIGRPGAVNKQCFLFTAYCLHCSLFTVYTYSAR